MAGTSRNDARESYRINEDADQVAKEQDRLHVLARVFDPATRHAIERTGITTGWACCDVGSGAGTIAAWMSEQVGASGRVVSVDVDTRFQAPSNGNVEVRVLDVTAELIGEAEFDIVHARGVLQHLVQREDVLDKMVAATKPGGWIVVGDADWIQFDAQPVPEPFATLSNTLRNLSRQQHGWDETWGRNLLDALVRRGLEVASAHGTVFTMRGGTDSAEWYVGALARAIDVLPAEVFPEGFSPAAAIDQARREDFAILSPISITATARRPAQPQQTSSETAAASASTV